jgi:hypothetical protein
VAAGAVGAFVVVWMRVARAADGLIDVFGRRYDSAGLALGTEFRVNSYTAGGQSGAAVAVGADGAFLVVWQSRRPLLLGVFGQYYDSDGQAQGTEFQVNSYTTGLQEAPAVAPLADGAFVVVWQSSDSGAVGRSGVFGQRFAPPHSSPTATPNLPTPTLARCVGDCDHNGKVAVNELVRGVNIALSTATLDGCPEFNCNGSGHVTVDCLVRAVNSALRGCAG